MLFIFTAILKQAGIINYTFIYNWRKYRSKVIRVSEKAKLSSPHFHPNCPTMKK